MKFSSLGNVSHCFSALQLLDHVPLNCIWCCFVSLYSVQHAGMFPRVSPFFSCSQHILDWSILLVCCQELMIIILGVFFHKSDFLLQRRKFCKCNYWFSSCRGHNYRLSLTWRKHHKKNNILLISLYYIHNAKAKSHILIIFIFWYLLFTLL